MVQTQTEYAANQETDKTIGNGEFSNKEEEQVNTLPEIKHQLDKKAISLLQQELQRSKNDCLQQKKTVSFLRQSLKRSVVEREKIEDELNEKEKEISHLQEKLNSILICTSKGEPTDFVERECISSLERNERTIAKLKEEIKSKDEMIQLLHFHQEILAQKFGEMRGMFLAKLQDSHKKRKKLKEEYKKDFASWNDLMNKTVEKLVNEMQSIQELSLAKIARLEQQLIEERRKETSSSTLNPPQKHPIKNSKPFASSFLSLFE